MQDNEQLINQAASQILRWRSNPVAFVEEVIKPTSISSQQRQVLETLPYHNFIAIKSGHGVGKSTLESWIILWFLTCYTDVRVPVTAPTEDQITKMLWPEVNKWLEPTALKNYITWTKSKIYVKGEEETAFAVYRTATRPEALQGFHATNLLFVLEEASGIEDEIWQPMEGALTNPGARAIAFGNPTRPEGEFYKIFTGNAGLWKTFTFSSADSELVSKSYVDRMKKKYGEDSDVYKVRVLGEFPSQTSDAFIPLYLCERSLGLEVAYTPILKMGVDVARFGDDYTVFLIRKGGKIIYVSKLLNIDTMQTVGTVKKLIKEFGMLPENVFIDAIGIGAGVVDALIEDGVEVTAVTVSESAESQDEIMYANKRAELYGIVKDELTLNKLNLTVENDPEITSELCGELASPKYKINRKGQYLLESKDDMKKRKVASPNIADALTLSYYYSDDTLGSVFASRPNYIPKDL